MTHYAIKRGESEGQISHNMYKCRLTRVPGKYTRVLRIYIPGSTGSMESNELYGRTIYPGLYVFRLYTKG